MFHCHLISKLFLTFLQITSNVYAYNTIHDNYHNTYFSDDKLESHTLYFNDYNFDWSKEADWDKINILNHDHFQQIEACTFTIASIQKRVCVHNKPNGAFKIKFKSLPNTQETSAAHSQYDNIELDWHNDADWNTITHKISHTDAAQQYMRNNYYYTPFTPEMRETLTSDANDNFFGNSDNAQRGIQQMQSAKQAPNVMKKKDKNAKRDFMQRLPAQMAKLNKILQKLPAQMQQKLSKILQKLHTLKQQVLKKKSVKKRSRSHKKRRRSGKNRKRARKKGRRAVKKGRKSYKKRRRSGKKRRRSGKNRRRRRPVRNLRRSYRKRRGSRGEMLRYLEEQTVTKNNEDIIRKSKKKTKRWMRKNKKEYKRIEKRMKAETKNIGAAIHAIKKRKKKKKKTRKKMTAMIRKMRKKRRRKRKGTNGLLKKLLSAHIQSERDNILQTPGSGDLGGFNGDALIEKCAAMKGAEICTKYDRKHHLQLTVRVGAQRKLKYYQDDKNPLSMMTASGTDRNMETAANGDLTNLDYEDEDSFNGRRLFDKYYDDYMDEIYGEDVYEMSDFVDMFDYSLWKADRMGWHNFDDISAVSDNNKEVQYEYDKWDIFDFDGSQRYINAINFNYDWNAFDDDKKTKCSDILSGLFSQICLHFDGHKKNVLLHMKSASAMTEINDMLRLDWNKDNDWNEIKKIYDDAQKYYESNGKNMQFPVFEKCHNMFKTSICVKVNFMNAFGNLQTMQMDDDMFDDIF